MSRELAAWAPAAWVPVFLRAYRGHGCLKRAALTAGVARSTVYALRSNCPEFVNLMTKASVNIASEIRQESAEAVE